jgi:hypothetical protein
VPLSDPRHFEHQSAGGEKSGALAYRAHIGAITTASHRTFVTIAIRPSFG